jgi:hypothetical protein
MADNFICNGTRNSKWYFDGNNYIRKMKTRRGEKTKTYTKEDISNIPESTTPDVVALKEHLTNLG